MLDMVENVLRDLEAIAKSNKEKARVLGERYTWYSTQKNKDIKSNLAREGENLSSSAQRLRARVSGNSGSGGEWLYDFALREFDSDNYFVGVPLVVEIELSDLKSGGLLYDFNKLMQSDADNKVFIFQKKYISGFEDAVKSIEGAIGKYSHKVSSEYLISCWITSEYTFEMKRMRVSK